MDTNEMLYSKFVANLAKPGADITESLTPEMADLLHMAVGIAGEAGELLDAVKKAAIYNKPLDLGNMIEELGDLEFYMQGVRNSLEVTRFEILEANMLKLTKRYHDGYSDAAAQARADKAEGEPNEN